MITTTTTMTTTITTIIDLKAETESEVRAAQNRALQTKHPATKIFQTETNSKCRLCEQFD